MGRVFRFDVFDRLLVSVKFWLQTNHDSEINKADWSQCRAVCDCGVSANTGITAPLGAGHEARAPIRDWHLLLCTWSQNISSEVSLHEVIWSLLLQAQNDVPVFYKEKITFTQTYLSSSWQKSYTFNTLTRFLLNCAVMISSSNQNIWKWFIRH